MASIKARVLFSFSILPLVQYETTLLSWQVQYSKIQMHQQLFRYILHL